MDTEKKQVFIGRDTYGVRPGFRLVLFRSCYFAVAAGNSVSND